MIESLFEFLGFICYVGVIFLGRYSLEFVGDYFVGLNYVFLINGIVKFLSFLLVDLFVKKFSIILYS